jgi:citrate synthase
MKSIHIPDNMFNVMFGISRSIGWIAHWREMMSDSAIKIYRPRQVYVGHGEREFVKIEDRAPAPGFNSAETSTEDDIATS